jgi:hypothetical protein
MLPLPPVLPTSPSSTPGKGSSRNFFGKHPFLNILTNKFYYMDFYEFSMNLN